MVAEGLGATILPDFSVIDDPLERGGEITWRPLRDNAAEVWLVMRRPRSGSHPRAARNLHRMFVDRAHTLELARFGRESARRQRAETALPNPCSRPLGR